jgi:hypothetical protein
MNPMFFLYVTKIRHVCAFLYINSIVRKIVYPTSQTAKESFLEPVVSHLLNL